MRPPLAALAAWHRRIGIGAAALVAWLAASGILLNHTGDLSLDERYARAGWLLDWYGIASPSRIVGYRAGGHWLTQVGERIYFDARPLAGEHGELVGAALVGGEIAAAAGGRLLLLTPDGAVAETLGVVHGVPEGISAIGLQAGRLIVRAERRAYAADLGLMRWREAESGNVDWSRPQPVPGELRVRLAADYRGRILTLERVLLDLHSGRVFGAVGILVMDAAAIAFVLLAVTGLWMWLKRNNGRSGTSAPKRQ